ncbi:uncharacterized protein LOC130673914 [Microplitis mediator]|uniref:uncharacterized protein LOC130673914 n=1 Tax=Microplitis mediator TaxID=375433 RepID=UPI0025540684|nr:uncharacterized protein LOC130673914 [Microplitis mediator]
MERLSRSPERKKTKTGEQSRSSSSSFSSSSSSSKSDSQVTTTTGSPDSTERFKERGDTPIFELDMPDIENSPDAEQKAETFDVTKEETPEKETIEVISLDGPETSSVEKRSRPTRQTTLKIKDPTNESRRIVVDLEKLEEQKIVIKGKEGTPLLEPPFSRVTRAKFAKRSKVSLTKMSREERQNMAKVIVGPLTRTIDEMARGGGEILTRVEAQKENHEPKKVKPSVIPP